MPDTPPESRPFQARRSPDLIDDHDPHGVFANWIAHLDAGRIGHAAPVDPAIAARRDATAAQFALYARDARRLSRERGW